MWVEVGRLLVVVFIVTSENKTQYAKFIPTKSTPLRYSVSKKALSIDFRGLCVLFYYDK